MGWFSSIVGGIVGFFVGGPVGAVIGAGIGATKVGEKIVDTVLDFVTQPFIGDYNMDAGSEAERQQGVLIQSTGSVKPIPVVYGYRKVGGHLAFAETGSTNNKYLYVAYVFSEGTVEGLREVFIDDWQLPGEQTANLNAGQLITVASDRYKDRVQLQWFPGVYFSRPQDSSVGTTVKNGIFADAPSFTSDMTFNGLAVLFARYEWKEINTQEDADNNPFSGNIPEVQVGMLGKRVASLLVDAENYTYDSAPVRYSTNPAEILLDYLRNPRYGKGLVNDDIHWRSWKVSARKCNQTVTYLDSANITGPIMTLNAVVDTGATLLSNTKTLLQNFRAYMPYVQGKYKLRIEDAGNPNDILSGAAVIVATFNKDNIVSDITFNGIEKSAKYNVVAVTYVDPDQKFSNQEVVYPETEELRQYYIDLDGGRENKLAVTLGHITNYAIAKDFARLMFNKSRYQDACSFTATSQALELEPGDNIRIQSNILNFEDIPWRVVSVKINGDMTVSISCVRNPDNIYPYVRVGEEDYVLPPFIPKGSVIYYPTSDNRVILGLIPPTKALYPDVFVPQDYNPGGTDPNATGGGGVGGEGPDEDENEVPIDEGDRDDSTQDDNGQDTPEDPPPPPPFDAVLKVVDSELEKVDTGYRFTLYFEQPDAAMYKYSVLWYRWNVYSPWIEVRLDSLPGAGGRIPWTVVLPRGNYEFYTRCFATDGRSSIKVTRGNFGYTNQWEQDPTFSGFTGQDTIQVVEGWTVPQPAVIKEPNYDDDIDLLEIRPVLTAGAPQDPRKMTVRMQQIENTLDAIYNPLIVGVRVYYKFQDDEYWAYEDYRFGGDYTPGTIVNFELNGEFGSRVYPGEAWYGSNLEAQKYDFLVRLIYADNTTAKKQVGPATARVEQNATGLYDYVAFGNTSDAAHQGAYVVDSAVTAAFNETFKTVDQDPDNTYADALSIIPNFANITCNKQKSEVTFLFNAPVNNLNRFRGFKLRYREIVQGTNPDFNEVDIGSAFDVYDRISYTLVNSAYSHNVLYEWVVTAVVYIPGTGRTECDYSWYSRTKIDYNDDEYNGLVSKFNWQLKATNEAKDALVTEFPAQPTIVAKNWIKKQVEPYVSGWKGATPYDSEASELKQTTTGNQQINRYYNLVFSAPDTADALVIYRRVYDVNGAMRTSVSTKAKYWGLGPWERVEVAFDDLTQDSDGFWSINLRGPIAPIYFDSSYELSPGKTLVYYQYGASGTYPYVGYTGALSDIYPYWGAGNSNAAADATSTWVEYLIVLSSSGTEEAKGLYLRDFYTIKDLPSYRPEVEGFASGNVEKGVIRNLSEYESFDSGYGRNLSEAITDSIPHDQLTPNSKFYGAGGAPSQDPYNTAAGFKYRVVGPSTGDTVY